MAWTAPRTWSTNEIVTASMMNTHVRDNLKYLKGQAGTVAIEDAMTVAGSVVATIGGNNQAILSALSGSSSVLAGIGVGRTASEVQMAIVASAAQFFTGSAAGDMILRNLDSSKKIMIGAGSTAAITISSGAVGIGRTAPQGILHTYDVISGMMKWEADAVAGSAVTVISDGAGDVLYGLNLLWGVRASDGNTASGTLSTGGAVLLVPGAAAFNLYNAGGNTLQLTCAANGSVTVARSAGALTYKVCLLLIWL